jgi:HlyD family secretion protein
MKKKVILISSGLILLISIIIFISYYFGNKKTVYYWRTSPVEKGDISLIVTATGLVSADTTVAIGTQVSGILSKLFVDFNSRVKKGQIIAQIDTTVLHTTKEEAQAAYEKTQALLDESNWEFERQKSLFDKQAIPKADYDISFTNLKSAKANVKSMKAQLERAIINLHYATIRSPINGIVISRNLDQGQTVIASFNTPTLFTIVNDLKKMQIQANVSEADIGEVKIGQDVDFIVDAYPNDVFTGHVQQIRLQPAVIQNVVNYTVIIDAANPNLKLMPGLTANISIKIKNQSQVLKVPANALSFMPPDEYIASDVFVSDSAVKKWRRNTEYSNQKIISPKKSISYIWVKKGGDIYPVEIKKGLSDGIFTEIEGSIKENDDVVTGINHSDAATKASTKQNPFIPKFPSRGRRM